MTMDYQLTGLGTIIILSISTMAYREYLIELKKFGSKKAFWIFRIQGAFSSFRGFADLVFWNIVLVLALPAGLIVRFTTWTIKNLKK